MGYKNGDEVWPDNLTDSGFEKAGQRYGAREVGNVGGVTLATSGEGRIVFEFDANELGATGALAAQIFKIPEGNAVITKAYVEVEEAFAAGTVDVEIDGTDIGTVPVSLTVAGMFDLALTTEPTAIDSTEEVTANTQSVTGTAGYAKVVVEFTRI